VRGGEQVRQVYHLRRVDGGGARGGGRGDGRVCGRGGGRVGGRGRGQEGDREQQIFDLDHFDFDFVIDVPAAPPPDIIENEDEQQQHVPPAAPLPPGPLPINLDEYDFGDEDEEVDEKVNEEPHEREPVLPLNLPVLPPLRYTANKHGNYTIVAVQRNDNPVCVFMMDRVTYGHGRRERVGGFRHARCIECVTQSRAGLCMLIHLRSNMLITLAREFGVPPLVVNSFRIVNVDGVDRWVDSPLQLDRHNADCRRDPPQLLTQAIVDIVMRNTRHRIRHDSIKAYEAWLSASCAKIFQYVRRHVSLVKHFYEKYKYYNNINI
jgi:hypothetical protein